MTLCDLLDFVGGHLPSMLSHLCVSERAAVCGFRLGFWLLSGVSWTHLIVMYFLGRTWVRPRCKGSWWTAVTQMTLHLGKHVLTGVSVLERVTNFSGSAYGRRDWCLSLCHGTWRSLEGFETCLGCLLDTSECKGHSGEHVSVRTWSVLLCSRLLRVYMQQVMLRCLFKEWT